MCNFFSQVQPPLLRRLLHGFELVDDTDGSSKCTDMQAQRDADCMLREQMAGLKSLSRINTMLALIVCMSVMSLHSRA